LERLEGFGMEGVTMHAAPDTSKRGVKIWGEIRDSSEQPQKLKQCASSGEKHQKEEEKSFEIRLNTTS